MPSKFYNERDSGVFSIFTSSRKSLEHSILPSIRSKENLFSPQDWIPIVGLVSNCFRTYQEEQANPITRPERMTLLDQSKIALYSVYHLTALGGIIYALMQNGLD